MLNRLALGTVQFGLPYGIANQTGQIGRDDGAAILDHAKKMGMDTLDTAIAYGESEQRLGEIGVQGWRVISKLPALPEHHADIGSWVSRSIVESLDRLKISRLYGLLLHHPQDLVASRGDVLYAELVGLRNQGVVEKIGLSIYSPDELDALWPRFRFDVVQAPFNIFDRRLANSGWLGKLHNDGAEIHTRSPFLQGLLLMDASARPDNFDQWRPLWDRWDNWLEQQRLTPLQAALGFVTAQNAIDRVIVGVDSLKHLEEIIAAVDVRSIEFPTCIESADLALINPVEWTSHEKM